MEYLLSINSIHHHNLIFKSPIKNQNDNFLYFYKLIYSNHFLNLKYILLKFDYTDYKIICKNNNYLLSINKNDIFLEKLRNLEVTILKSINIHVKKNIVCNCYDDIMKKQYLYCFQTIPNLKNLSLKISGIWEDNYNIGLVYKLYYNISTEKLSNMIC